jgi:hypothetical protein
VALFGGNLLPGIGGYRGKVAFVAAGDGVTG